MQVTDIDFTCFHGGQIESRSNIVLYRGEIGTINLDSAGIAITLAWHAKGVSQPRMPLRWVNYEIPIFRFPSRIYQINQRERGRVEFFLPSSGICVTLYLPGDNTLLRSQVENLR